MLSEKTISDIRALEPELATRGVTGISVFGSQLTDLVRPDSDIDIIVDYNPESRFSLFDLVAVGRIIEDRIGIKTDVMTRTGLHPVLKDTIEKSAMRIY